MKDEEQMRVSPEFIRWFKDYFNDLFLLLPEDWPVSKVYELIKAMLAVINELENKDAMIRKMKGTLDWISSGSCYCSANYDASKCLKEIEEKEKKK